MSAQSSPRERFYAAYLAASGTPAVRALISRTGVISMTGGVLTAASSEIHLAGGSSAIQALQNPSRYVPYVRTRFPGMPNLMEHSVYWFQRLRSRWCAPPAYTGPLLALRAAAILCALPPSEQPSSCPNWNPFGLSYTGGSQWIWLVRREAATSTTPSRFVVAAGQPFAGPTGAINYLARYWGPGSRPATHSRLWDPTQPHAAALNAAWNYWKHGPGARTTTDYFSTWGHIGTGLMEAATHGGS